MNEYKRKALVELLYCLGKSGLGEGYIDDIVKAILKILEVRASREELK